MRPGLETVGGGAKDQIALDFLMGHARDDMATAYRERIDDARLRVVTDHVHAWLFPPTAEKPKGKKKGATGGSSAEKKPAAAG